MRTGDRDDVGLGLIEQLPERRPQTEATRRACGFEKVLRHQSRDDALHGRARQADLGRNATQAESLRMRTERTHDPAGAGDDLDPALLTIVGVLAGFCALLLAFIHPCNPWVCVCWDETLTRP